MSVAPTRSCALSPHRPTGPLGAQLIDAVEGCVTRIAAPGGRSPRSWPDPANGSVRRPGSPATRRIVASPGATDWVIFVARKDLPTPRGALDHDADLRRHTPPDDGEAPDRVRWHSTAARSGRRRPVAGHVCHPSRVNRARAEAAALPQSRPHGDVGHAAPVSWPPGPRRCGSRRRRRRTCPTSTGRAIQSSHALVGDEEHRNRQPEAGHQDIGFPGHVGPPPAAARRVSARARPCATPSRASPPVDSICSKA